MILTYTLKRKKAERPQTVRATAVHIAVDNRNTLAFVEISGALSARRAIWAELVRGRTKVGNDAPLDTDIHINWGDGNDKLRIAAKTSYLTRNVEENIIVMHPGFGPNQRTHLMGGDFDTPPLYFMEAFRVVMTQIPVLPHESTFLWRKGIERGLVSPLRSVGDQMFWKLTHSDRWIDVIKEA